MANDAHLTLIQDRALVHGWYFVSNIVIQVEKYCYMWGGFVWLGDQHWGQYSTAVSW